MNVKIFQWIKSHILINMCRSENLEGLGDLSICVRNVPKVGGWKIYTEDGEWVTDETFEVKCVED